MTILMLLADLPLSDILDTSPDFDFSADCSSCSRDARTTEDNALFFCIRGTRFDGHTAIRQAAAHGAVAAILSDPAFIADCPLPWICVRDTRALYLPALLCANGHPERCMTFFAVTGTNGKTSVSYLLDAIFSQDERLSPTARIGTVENKIADTVFPTNQTTPPPEILCALLCQARERGVKTVVLEASSHALTQGRLAGLHFTCGIFTNLTEDHLDYHKSMEEYYQAKRTLFSFCDTALVNADDPYCRRLTDDRGIPAKKHAFTLQKHPCADFRAHRKNIADGCALTLSREDGETLSLYSPLSGSFAAYNITAAVACAHLAGVDAKTVQAGLSSLAAVPGRMERIVSDPFTVCIDYAHTPDALERAVLSAKEGARRVLLLIGCGGDREREKRPLMGNIAATYADVCVITSDNSRSEDPHAILSDICAGIPAQPHADVTVICDRKDAIEMILAMAVPGDTVLLCGKGHETTHTDASGVHPFCEKEIVLNFLKDRKESRK